jgi:pyruvate kinase
VTGRTKIVATLGPACEEPAAVEALLRAGVDVVRLNLSHGPIEDHLDRLAMVRSTARKVGRPVGVLADLPGPKIRSGEFPIGGVRLETNSQVRLVPGTAASTDHTIHVDYARLLDDVEPGDRIVIGDGAIVLVANSVQPEVIVAEVQSGGRAQGRPGVHLSAEGLQLAAPTGRDLELAETIASAGVDFVGLSFVRRAADVDALRTRIGDRAAIIAKIETAAALDDLIPIVAAADGIMVARGDLGIECAPEDVPLLQKHIIRSCRAIGKPVITATQMLESMIHAPTPTRAEVSDVANAVFDGTDAVMLSGETAIGEDPVGVVSMMRRITDRAESEMIHSPLRERLVGTLYGRPDGPTEKITAAVTHAAWQAARDAGASAILCCTRGGRTARAMARLRPAARLVGLSPDSHTVGAMTMSWGLEPVHVGEYLSSDEMIWSAVDAALAGGYISPGDIVLILARGADGARGTTTDMLRILRVE